MTFLALGYDIQKTFDSQKHTQQVRARKSVTFRRQNRERRSKASDPSIEKLRTKLAELFLLAEKNNDISGRVFNHYRAPQVIPKFNMAGRCSYYQRLGHTLTTVAKRMRRAAMLLL